MPKGYFLKKSLLLLPVFLMLFPFRGSATHQRAAEITYRHLSGNTFQIILVSYTFTPSQANAFRDVLLVNYGDGTVGNIVRIVRDSVGVDITYNKYIGEHTYSAPGQYTITCEDPNRNAGILNFPNSVNIPMFIFSELIINPFTGAYNNSPVLLLPPIDNACVDQPFYHNPGAYDPDGDSLSYKLVPNLGAGGLVIPGYSYPEASDSLVVNPITGDLIWASPVQAGEYNVAILIEEWRDRQKIGSVLRDMQINVIACNNHPPVIEVQDTCVEAGNTLVFSIRATDPDSDRIMLTGAGEPLLLTDHPASLVPPTAIGNGEVTSIFTWPTACTSVKRLPYHMYFKASDNYSPVNLVTIRTVKIRVVGPAPENLAASPLGTSINLSWDSYSCPNAKGFYIYRKSDSTGFVHDYCETGVPGYLGYRRIGQVDDITVTSFSDNDKGPGLVQGIRYCYLITAYFEDQAESYASNEVCAYLKKDVAVITNVSVNTTSVSNGSMYVAWSKPTEIDTVQAPGPYRYLIYRISGTAEMLIDSLPDLNDTTYTDTLLNTLQNQYRYRIDLYNVTPGLRFLIGPSRNAPSIYMVLQPTDRRMRIRWNDDVPWFNYQTTIYRKSPGSATFDSIGISTTNVFDDTGLINGEEYCYFLKTTGAYSAPGFVDPIINFSQLGCAVPVDNIPPCPPVLSVIPYCSLNENHLRWTLSVSDSCDTSISKLYFYYRNSSGGPLTLIDSLMYAGDTVFIHRPGNTIVGCYTMVAVDSAGNRSLSSDTVCIDLPDFPECNYHLPNVFTPNGDAVNQFFTPFPGYASVDHISMTILSRWGNTVFTTDNPEILWDGKGKDTGQPVSDGVYYYVCEVYEITLRGLVPRIIKGTVTVLR